MKNLKIAIFSLVLLGAGVSLGAIVAYDYTPTKNNTILNNKYFDENTYKVFRFQDTVGTTTSTCYAIEFEVYRGVNNQRNVSLSCVK